MSKDVVFPPELSEKQELFYDATEDEVLYGGSAGGGKMSPLDSCVYTPFGAIRMGDVKIGTQVSNPDGTIAKVIAIYPQGVKEVYSVTFDDGSSCEVGLEHLWLVREARVRRFRKKPISEKLPRWRLATTEELMKHIKRKHILIPLTQKVEFTITSRNSENKWPIEPYFLGCLLGDGYIGNSIVITSADEEIIKKISFSYNSVYQKPNNKAKSYAYSETIGKKLDKLGLRHKRSWEKHIPSAYKIAPVAIREALLQGLMDTDGYIDKRGHPSYTTTSKQLAEDVRWLVLSLGYKANITSKTPTYNHKGERKTGRLAYTVWIKPTTKEEAELLFSLKRKRRRCMPFNNSAGERGRRIVSIVFSRKAECQCIKVNHPNGLYLTDDFIVTHNSEVLLITAIAYMLVGQNRGILFRESYPELERSLIMRSLEIIPDGLGKYHEGKKRWFFPSTGSYLEFGYLETDKDVAQYKSAEYGFIGWDELTHQSEYRYKYMYSRLRTTNPKIKPIIRAASNPGSIGNGWVKKHFRIGEIENETFVSDGFSKRFIPAKVFDNPWIMKNDPGYIKRLEALPENERRMLLEGRWDVFEGQAFGEWDPKLHVVTPFEIPGHWKRFRSIDPGYNQPLAVLWFAYDPEGYLYCYRELYSAGLIATESGQKMIDMSKNEDISYTVCGPDAWSKRGEVGESVAETWIKMGIFLTRANKSKGSRILGKMRVHEWLKDGKLKFFSTVKNTIRTIPEMILDENNLEDIDDKGEDHCVESLKDFLMSRPSPAIERVKVEPVLTLEQRMQKHAMELSKKTYTDKHLGSCV